MKLDSSTKRGQTRENVLNLYNFMNKEGEKGKCLDIRSLEKTTVESAKEGERSY
jgi:hypothetical protein